MNNNSRRCQSMMFHLEDEISAIDKILFQPRKV